jgi:hypothetical protein
MALPTYISDNNPVGRIHLDRNCEGLERIDPEQITRLPLHSLRAAARRELRLPCRRCALGPVLHELLDSPLGSVPALVAVASLPRRDRYGRNGELSETGVTRIEALARHPGWQLTSTELGPVAFGITTRPTARLIARNLYTLVSEPTDERCRPAVVACALSLAVDRYGSSDPQSEDETVWKIAEALCA